MGFWDFMNRMFGGKPVFDNADYRDEDGNPLPVPEDKRYPETTFYSPRAEYRLPVDEHGREVYPQLHVVQSRVHESGDGYLDLWLTVENKSDRTIELENIDILGQVLRCRHRFVPGQQRQIETYKGPAPENTNYQKAFLYYKEMEGGCYFNSVHQILYHVEHSTRYLPMNFRFLQAFKND